ncbi:MAG: P27 family phage terminase small subunit [Planctomycetota bacterium]
MTDQPEPPEHLQPATAAWWRDVLAEFELEAHHLRLLRLACEAWDRAQQARLVLAEEGLIFTDRFGQPRSRPEVAIERDSRTAFARLLRELQLDCAEPEPVRPAPIRTAAMIRGGGQPCQD